LTANGPFDTNLVNGFPGSSDYGDSFLKLSTNGSLGVADYFTPFDQAADAEHDTDLGSGGTVLLPDVIDATGRTRHLALGAGKDGNIYLVDRDNMGKYLPGATSNSNVYQELAGALPGGGSRSPRATAIVANAQLACIRNSNRLWVSRSGCESLSELGLRGPAYPQPGKVPDFLFGPFSFVNNGFEGCEQAWMRWILWASPPSLFVASMKLKKTSEPRLGAAALSFGRFEQISADRLIGAPQPAKPYPNWQREHPLFSHKHGQRAFHHPKRERRK
jgi:hypothetical protein